LLLVLGCATATLTLIALDASPGESSDGDQHSADEAHALLDAVTAADLPEEKVAACVGAAPGNLRLALAEAADTLTRIALARCLAPHDPDTARHALDRIAQDPDVAPFLRQEAGQSP
jgi:hypothetical protein